MPKRPPRPKMPLQSSFLHQTMALSEGARRTVWEDDGGSGAVPVMVQQLASMVVGMQAGFRHILQDTEPPPTAAYVSLHNTLQIRRCFGYICNILLILVSIVACSYRNVFFKVTLVVLISFVHSVRHS
ncbi:hypothetical protein OF83DRAFT_1293587 [Amylostereum chailletii]|nr:hypothetical protein OF83DRAFT_1293587 [Amylostereum chailletii]